MRYAIAVILLVAGLGWNGMSAAQDYLDIVDEYVVIAGETIIRLVRCPEGYVPLYVLTPSEDPGGTQIRQQYVDRDGLPAVYNAVNDAGGYLVTITKDGSGSDSNFDPLILRCVKASIAGIAPLPPEVTVAPQQTSVIFSTCPPPDVALGFATNVDGVDLQERFRVYLYGTSPNLVPLNNMPDGTHPAPTQTGIGVRNNTAAPLVLRVATICATLTDAQTLIVSSPVVAGQSHAVFAPVPDGQVLVGNSFTVSGSARNNLRIWDHTGLVSSQGYTVPVTWVPKGVYLEGNGTPPSSSAKQQVVGRAVIGSLVVPSTTPVPPPAIVPVVEFYHAGLDHYFITANPKEIADLDAGVHAGWQRTGEAFNAYGVGSSGRTGRRPVCRAYGNPAAGLDSHFYSASPQECSATLENFGDDWLLEASEVFELELPDTTTGACPADRVPVYRLWNNRADSSHRFVKSLSLRAQMIARGFVSEGYGANGVVFCALV